MCTDPSHFVCLIKEERNTLLIQNIPGNAVLSSTKEDHHNTLLVTCHHLIYLYKFWQSTFKYDHGPLANI